MTLGYNGRRGSRPRRAPPSTLIPDHRSPRRAALLPARVPAAARHPPFSMVQRVKHSASASGRLGPARRDCAILTAMASASRLRRVAFRPVPFLLAALIAATAFAGPAGAARCTVRESCCPQEISSQDQEHPGLDAPVPPCCRQLAPAVGAPQGDRAERSPGAPVVELLPAPRTPALALSV